MNIIEDRGVYVGKTMYQDKTLRSREATFDKVRDALYDKINISVEAMMPNITVKKKKSTRGEASTTKYQEGRQMETSAGAQHGLWHIHTVVFVKICGKRAAEQRRGERTK